MVGERRIVSGAEPKLPTVLSSSSAGSDVDKVLEKLGIPHIKQVHRVMLV